MDDILLMAYVDGELSPDGCKEVERAIQTSADVARRLECFEASVLPYQRAFQCQELPPVPESLTRNIAEIAKAYAVPSYLSALADPRRAAGPASPPDARARRVAPIRSRLRQGAPWLAAAFVAGAFCCGAILHLAPGDLQSGFARSGVQVAGQRAASPWVMAAVDYQRLYTRDTLAFDAANPTIAAHTANRIRSNDGMAIRVPDLRSLGLTFKRIQRLSFNHQPLVQIVYLPEKGQPVALCVMKDEQQDAAMVQQQLDGMQVVTWRRAKLSYALIATPGDGDLNAIGRRIADASVEEILGEASPAYQSHASEGASWRRTS